MKWPGFVNLFGAWFLLALIPLIILYFLKLRRPRMEVPSLALWQSVVNDQRVNSPFQKLKYSLLLLLQLLLVALLGFALPSEPPRTGGNESRSLAGLLELARRPALMPLYAGVFALHFIMTATFLSVPQALVTDLGIASAGHWKVYLGVFVASLAGTIPLILATERTGRGPALFILAILAVAAAQALLGFDHRHLWVVLGGLTLFFAGFNYLEARLPAQLTLAAPGHERGAALGIFATAQFFGAFLGGALGGVLLGRFGLAGVFWGSAVVALAWAAVAAGTRQPAANRHEPG